MWSYELESTEDRNFLVVGLGWDESLRRTRPCMYVTQVCGVSLLLMDTIAAAARIPRQRAPSHERADRASHLTRLDKWVVLETKATK